MAATTRSVWPSSIRTSWAWGLCHGIELSAAVQYGRSAVGSRCTVPRGP